MTFYISFASTGGVVFSYVVAALVSSWEYNFAVSAISLLALAGGLYLFTQYLTPHMKWDQVETLRREESQVSGATARTNHYLFVKSGFYFMLVATIFAVTASQSRSSLAPIMFVENYPTISPAMGNLFNVILLVAGLIGTIVAQKLVTKVKQEVVGMVGVFLAIIPLQILCILVGNIPVGMMVGLLALIAVLESTVSLLRNYYNMHFVPYGKSGTAAGILNAGMSLSYFVAGYLMPLIVEWFGWKGFIATWPVLLAVSAVALSLVIKRVKRWTQEQN